MKRYLPFLIIGVVLVAAIGAGLALLRRPGAATGQAIPSDLATRPLTATSQPAGPPGQGAVPAQTEWQPEAAVVLEEFGDYQCPPCGSLYQQLEQLEATYGKRVRLVFRHFPLTNIHENALDAARAAEAAGMQGRFWQMHDQLYKNQQKWAKNPRARQLFTEYAGFLGLDLTRFARDIDSMQANTRVRQDVERGVSLGVTGTPTVFLNGRELTLDTPQDLPKALDAALGANR